MGFEEAVEAVLKVEKGFVDRKNDHGGPTNWGVTMATLSSFRLKGVSAEDIKNLTVDEAKAVYKKDYWDAMKLDQVTATRLARILFDQAVNRGVGTVVRNVQSMLNLKVDGIIGPETIQVLNACDDKKMALEYVKRSQLYYAKLCVKDPTQLEFLVGWLARTHELLEIAIS